MKIFELSKRFPREETYSLTDQIRRSSRSITTNIAEAWRKKAVRAHFISKLPDAETEGAETQVWLEYAVACGYLPAPSTRPLYKEYDEILAVLVTMIRNPNKWTIG